MTISELLEKLQPEVKVKIQNKEFTLLEHIVWWQAKANKTYDKYVLQDVSGENTTRLYISGDFIGFATLIHHDFQEPLPKKIEFNGNNYTLTEDEFCIVKKIEGQEFYKVGDGEMWWDYVNDADNSTGLSLGRSWDTWEREDLATLSLSPDNISFV